MGTPRPAMGGGGSLPKAQRGAAEAAKHRAKQAKKIARREARLAKAASGANLSATGEAHDLQWMKAPPR
jgi:hypothetical protein